MIIEPGYCQPVSSANGNPLASGKLHIRIGCSMSTAPAELFRNPEFSEAAENPVTLNGSGAIPFPVYVRENEAWAFAHDFRGVFVKSWPVYGPPPPKKEEAQPLFDRTFSFGCAEPFPFCESYKVKRLVDLSAANNYFFYLVSPPQKWKQDFVLKKYKKIETVMEECDGNQFGGIDAYAILCSELSGGKFEVKELAAINKVFGVGTINISNIIGDVGTLRLGVAVRQNAGNASIFGVLLNDTARESGNTAPLRVQASQACIEPDIKVVTPSDEYIGPLEWLIRRLSVTLAPGSNSNYYVEGGQELDVSLNSAPTLPHACVYFNAKESSIKKGDTYTNFGSEGAQAIPWFSVSMASWGLYD